MSGTSAAASNAGQRSEWTHSDGVTRREVSDWRGDQW